MQRKYGHGKLQPETSHAESSEAERRAVGTNSNSSLPVATLVEVWHQLLMVPALLGYLHALSHPPADRQHQHISSGENVSREDGGKYTAQFQNDHDRNPAPDRAEQAGLF